MPTLEPPSLPPNKSVRTRRRLHEAEVISTTPCTAPRRSPQVGLPPNLSPIRPSAPAPRRSESVQGTVHEYSRISNKTGGFEGSLPLQYDLVFADDDTVHFNNTVQSSPEMGQEGRHRGGRGTPKRNRLFQMQRRLSFVDRENSPQQQRRGFFNRWTSFGSAKPGQVASSSSSSHHRSKAAPDKPLDAPGGPTSKSRGPFRSTAATFTAEDTSDLSFTKSQVATATPVRRMASKSSPRFALPDETPPGPSRNAKGSIANTSAAVAGRRSQNSSSAADDQGFEMSIASAPPTYSSPMRLERSAPVDLDDEVESSCHEETPNTRTRRLRLFSAARSLSASPSKRRPKDSSQSPAAARATKKSILPSFHLHSDNQSEVSSNFSVTPLQSMEDLKLETTAALRPRVPSMKSSSSSKNNKLKNWVVVPMRRKGGPSSITAVSLLEKERRQGKKRESDEVQSVSPDQRESIFANIELVDKDSSAGRTNPRTARNTSLTQSTMSSSKDAVVVKLPRCVVCNGRDRTHIAIPCMHFAYCRDCAMSLAKKGRGCVLCSIEHVTFAAVSV